MSTKSNFWKMILAVVVVFLFVAGVDVFASSRQQERLDGQANQQPTNQAKNDNVISEALALYYDDGRIFIKENLKQFEIDGVKAKEQESSDSGAVVSILEDVQWKFDLQTAINDLYEIVNGKTALNGPVLQRYVLVKANLKAEDITHFKNKFEDQLTNANKKTNGFVAAINTLAEESENQLLFMDNFKQQIEDIRQNSSITYADLKLALDTRRKEVASLKNPYFKSRLIEIIGDADRELTQKIGDNRLHQAQEAGFSEAEVAIIEEENQREEVEASERRENDFIESDELLASEDLGVEEDLSVRPASEIGTPTFSEPPSFNPGSDWAEPLIPTPQEADKVVDEPVSSEQHSAELFSSQLESESSDFSPSPPVLPSLPELEEDIILEPTEPFSSDGSSSDVEENTANSYPEEEALPEANESVIESESSFDSEIDGLNSVESLFDNTNKQSIDSSNSY